MGVQNTCDWQKNIRGRYESKPKTGLLSDDCWNNVFCGVSSKLHIQKVRIHGFKSFCDKTVFSFGRGLSGVVGPNGCGKSNVFDAVSGALESNLKSLRGSSMSDVIFNGSKISPSSTAEVAIVFSKGEKSISSAISYLR